MKQVDPVRVGELLRQLALRRSYLDELRRLSRRDFLGDFRNTEAARHALLIAIQVAIDVCNHIAARQPIRAPADYADCFVALGEQRILTTDLTARLRKMAQFRNRLAHLYWQIDEAELYDILQHDLGDLDEFRDQIVRWMAGAA